MRTSKGTLSIVTAFTATVAIALAAPSNGDFESGDFDGWKTFDSTVVTDTRSKSTGVWQVYKGKLKVNEDVPPRGNGGKPPKLAEPPQGKYAAGLYTLGEGSHILHRVLDANGKSEISMQLAYKNTADDFYVQDSLSEDPPFTPRGMVGEYPNQQLRIDLLKPNAPIDTLKNSDIIDTLLKTKPGDKRKRKYSKLEANVNGGRFRLRIAEVDNVGPFLVGVDAVKLKEN